MGKVRGKLKWVCACGRMEEDYDSNPLPKSGSPGEALFALHCATHKLDLVREFRFAAPRRWRFDFYFPDHKLAVEIDGGIWSGGRHSRGGKAYEADLEKFNTATLMGIRTLRYSTAMVEAGTAINDVLKVIL